MRPPVSLLLVLLPLALLPRVDFADSLLAADERFTDSTGGVLGLLVVEDPRFEAVAFVARLPVALERFAPRLVALLSFLVEDAFELSVAVVRVERVLLVLAALVLAGSLLAALLLPLLDFFLPPRVDLPAVFDVDFVVACFDAEVRAARAFVLPDDCLAVVLDWVFLADPGDFDAVDLAVDLRLVFFDPAAFDPVFEPVVFEDEALFPRFRPDVERPFFCPASSRPRLACRGDLAGFFLRVVVAVLAAADVATAFFAVLFWRRDCEDFLPFVDEATVSFPPLPSSGPPLSPCRSITARTAQG